MRTVSESPSRLVMQSRGNLFPILFGLVFVLLGLGLGYILGQRYALTCTRPEPAYVDCQLDRTLLGYPVGSRSLPRVSRAYLDVSESSDGDTYRVVLVTASGEVPLTGYYSSERAPQWEAVRELEAFLASSEDASVTVYSATGRLGFLFAAIFALSGVAALFVGLQTTTLTLDRLRNEFDFERRWLLARTRIHYPLAEIDSAYVAGNGSTFRPVLRLTSGEEVPLSRYYSSGRESKAALVSAINNFLGTSPTASG